MRGDRQFAGQDLDVLAVSHEVRGVTHRYEYAQRPQIAIAVAVEASGRLVLIRQYRAGVGAETLELPAGKIGDGVERETPVAAMVRELREEAGFAASGLEALGVLRTAPHFSDEICHVYEARGAIVGDPSPGPREDLAVELFDVSSLLDLIHDGELVDAKSLAALFLSGHFAPVRGAS